MKKHVGVVTAARSDYGLLLPLIENIYSSTDFDLTVYATGMHFSKKHGATVEEIRKAPWASELIEIPSSPENDSAEAAAHGIARGIEGFSAAYNARRPDIVLVMGDRMDAIASIIAALPFDIPCAHVSGGELSEGVVDDRVRHAITKMSHIHFTAHPVFAKRVIQMGEHPKRVIMSGEPGLDLLSKIPLVEGDRVRAEYKLNTDHPITVFTMHPVGPERNQNRQAIKTILKVASKIKSQIMFTYPNADPGSAPIIEEIKAYCAMHSGCKAKPSLGRQNYLSLISIADCMVGNSSSGLVEAASFQLPVVNIGDRQRGRISPNNVINAPLEENRIFAAWKKALSPSFRKSLDGTKNPYGDGNSVKRILNALREIPDYSKLTNKTFYDLSLEHVYGRRIR